MNDQHYTITLEVHSRTPLEVADDLADMLEKVGNEVLETPYPYEVAIVKELDELESALAQVTLEAKLFTRVGDEYGVLSSTIEKSVKLGVQALKIAHILEQYRKQETGENENE